MNKSSSSKLVEELGSLLKEAQTEPFSGQSLGRKMTDEELVRALRLDLEAEMDAINLYESHLQATDNEEAKKILEHVIKEEKDHVVLFSELLKTLDPEQAEIWSGGEEYFSKALKGGQD
jgi:rubrerythrin